MAKLQLLNNLSHKDLRVFTRYGAQYGDNVGSVLTFPVEYDDLHKEYPVLLRRHPTHGLQSVALLGFSAQENLFLNELYPSPPSAGSWMARYVPAMIAKGPFMIGYQQQDGQSEPVIHVDMDHPRISHDAGEGTAVFLPKGGQSGYLQKIASTLQRLDTGQKEADLFYREMDHLNLLVPVNFTLTLNSGEKISVEGHETVCSETFASLPSHSLSELHRKGWLNYIIFLQSSLANMNWLIEMKNTMEIART